MLMKVPLKINHFRRRAMNSLTKNIGNTSEIRKMSTVKSGAIKKVLIIRPNHRLGNMLLNTPLIQEVSAAFPNAKIDMLVKGGLAPIIFQNYNCINEYIILPKRPFNEPLKYVTVWIKMTFKKYDLIVNAVEGSSSGKLLTLITKSKYKIYQNPEDGLDNSNSVHTAKQSIYAFRKIFTGQNFKAISADIPLLDLKLSTNEITKGQETIDLLFDNDKKTIAIFTYATGNKCYSTSWWNIFYEQLKKQFPTCNILEILPVENVSQINFKTTSFYSKDIREIAAVMANSDIFIGADSGIMHLASASGVPTIGLFTGRIEAYKPYGNSNCAVDTTKTDLNHWMTKITGILNSTAVKKTAVEKVKLSSVHL